MRRADTFAAFALLAIALPAGQALAQDEAGGGADDLAQQLANPIASLISVPLQLNYDDGFGPDDEGHRWTLNVQPVIPEYRKNKPPFRVLAAGSLAGSTLGSAVGRPLPLSHRGQDWRHTAEFFSKTAAPAPFSPPCRRPDQPPPWPCR